MQRIAYKESKRGESVNNTVQISQLNMRKGFRMNTVYSYKFEPIDSLLLKEMKEMSGKFFSAVLCIHLSSGVSYDLKLVNPKVPSESSTNVKELCRSTTTTSIDCLEVVGKQHEPGKRVSDILWYIYFLKNGKRELTTIHCNEIDGLPDQGWR